MKRYESSCTGCLAATCCNFDLVRRILIIFTGYLIKLTLNTHNSSVFFLFMCLIKQQHQILFPTMCKFFVCNPQSSRNDTLMESSRAFAQTHPTFGGKLHNRASALTTMLHLKRKATNSLEDDAGLFRGKRHGYESYDTSQPGHDALPAQHLDCGGDFPAMCFAKDASNAWIPSQNVSPQKRLANDSLEHLHVSGWPQIISALLSLL